MFGKSNSTEDKMKKIEGGAISSIVDKLMCITGTIAFQGKARIDGTVKGNIEGEHLILSQTGKIEGDILLESFTCYGTLIGNIQADILVARKGCSISGTLEATSLTVEPGARIEGEIKAATGKDSIKRDNSSDIKPQSK